MPITNMTQHDYGYTSPELTHDSSYLLNPVRDLLKNLTAPKTKIFELGCGNGAHTAILADDGYELIGVDTSESGIQIAQKAFPQCRFEVASAYDDLAAKYGSFDCVLSLEVVEHLYDPKTYARNVYQLLNPGGCAIISTPYHGYLKNLAIAALGKFDAHVSPLWDGGHIKFWSKATLTQLLKEAGFSKIEFRLVGRFPALAKSMIAIAKKV